MIDVTLLGPPHVERDGRPVTFDTRKAVALLAYLALSDRPRPRDVLAELLWPDGDVEHARGALRRTLSTLRSAIGPDRVEATRDHVSLRTGPGLVVDVHQFRAAVAADDLAAAATVYRGELLEGFFVGDAPAFEDWHQMEADALRRELGTVLTRLAADRELDGDLAGALQIVRRWLGVDELHEPAQQALIRLSALTGDRAGAMAHYRDCVRTLSRELGVAPLRETTLLYEAISQGTLKVPAVAPPPRRREPSALPLIGRDPTLDRLLAAHRETSQRGRVTVIEGEAGIGKTRLAEEFLSGVRGQGAITMVGRAYEDESKLAYAPVIEALRARLLEDSGWAAQVSERSRQETARLLPELVRPAAGPPPALDAPGAAENFLAGLWETLVAATTGACPGVLLIDDAQWADEASLSLLTYGLRRLADRPVHVLLTWRTPHDHPFRRVIAELDRSGRAAVHTLERLDVKQVGELLGAAHPHRAGPELEQRLFAETEGLPFLLVEYLRVLDPAADDWDLPEGARDLLRSRLDPVTETGRQILSAAAVLGRSFDATTVRVTSGRAEDETVAALEELTDSGLIREGSLDYDFSHEKLRAMVYADTSLARRRLLHGRAAHTAADAVTAARHLQLAGDDRAAALAYARAADQARSVYAHAEAAGHLQAALALGHPDPSAMHAGVGELQMLAGDYAGALGSYEQAAAMADDDRLSSIEHSLGQLHHRRGDWGLARAHLQAALRAAPPDDDGGNARITADLSLAALACGDTGRAADLAQRAYELAVAGADPRALAQADNLLGLLAASAGRTTEALDHLRSSLALAEQIGDVSARIAALNNLALTHRARGDTAEAVALTRDALARCAEVGDRHREAALHNNLADLLHTTGQPEDAMQHLKLAVSRFAEVGADGGHQPEIWKLVRW